MRDHRDGVSASRARLAGTHADRFAARLRGREDGGRWHGVFYSRSAGCEHLCQWDMIAPRLGDLAWCSRCKDYRAVRFVYLSPRSGSMAVCGKKSMAAVRVQGAHGPCVQVVQVFCSSPSGHEGEHYDDAFSVAWRTGEDGGDVLRRVQPTL